MVTILFDLDVADVQGYTRGYPHQQPSTSKGNGKTISEISQFFHFASNSSLRPKYRVQTNATSSLEKYKL
jgi:hypothetical protein